jgi:hypothetical protein
VAKMMMVEARRGHGTLYRASEVAEMTGGRQSAMAWWTLIARRFPAVIRHRGGGETEWVVPGEEVEVAWKLGRRRWHSAG